MVNGPKEQTSEPFFVQIKEPFEVKRNILETLKDILQLLQQFEKFKQLRHEKLKKIQKLRSLIRDTNKILGILKSKLPQTSFKLTVPKPAQKQAKKGVARKKENTHKKHKTELDRLEAELNAIEEKLKGFV